MSDVERVSGAMRRRQRRLRSWLKHERQTVRTVLAETFHHSSAPFPPKFMEELVGRHVQHDALRGTEDGKDHGGHALHVEDQCGRGSSALRKPGGGRPAPLPEVAGRHVCLERHVMKDLGSVCPLVQILDLPVSQMADYVVGALRLLDRPMAEQVIEVPKISCSPCPSRSFVPVPQSAEQLVEVPTVLTPTRIALRIAEQIVDTPVPRGRGQGSLPGQSTTATASSLERITERTVEQIVDTSPPGAGLGQGASSSAGPADEDYTKFFAVFPMEKSAECLAGGECAAG